MPEYLSPGVYIEEIDVGTKPIEGVSTSNLGAVGRTERGPRDVRLVLSYLEFQRLYGDPIKSGAADVYTSHAVKGFFDNGGRRLFFGRAVSPDAKTAQLAVGQNLILKAIGPGTFGNCIYVQVTEPGRQTPEGDHFKVVVLYYKTKPDTWPNDFVDPTDPRNRSDKNFRAPAALETFDNVTWRPDAPNFVVRAMAGSNLVRAEWTGTGETPPMTARGLDLDSRLRLKRRTDADDGIDTTKGDLLVRINPAAGADAAKFNLRVLHYAGGIPSSFDPRSVNPPANPTTEWTAADLAVAAGTPADPNANPPVAAVPAQPEGAIGGIANRLMDVEWIGTGARTRPANSERWMVIRQPGYEALAEGGDGGTSAGDVLTAHKGYEVTDETRNGQPFVYSTGLMGLENIDEVNLLMVPDEHTVAGIRAEVINQCERLRERFAILSVNPARRSATDIISNNDADPPTSFAALYWPWIFVTHPVTADRILVPPVGHAAGIYARTDVERGVHKAPANEAVRGALDLQFPVARGQQDILNPRGVNVIRDFRPDGRGIRVWGARTLSDDPMWKYINVRRLFLFLEESIEEGTQWVVFEPNSEALWDRVRRSVESFLLTVWRNGALMGTRPDQAFYVKCDRTTMTQDDIDNGRLICYIGVAPVKPAEFVIFRIHQWALGAKTAV
jgi:phage tail sheath protein FI